MCVNVCLCAYCEIILYLSVPNIYIACKRQQRIIYFSNDEGGFRNNNRSGEKYVLVTKVTN